MPFDYATSAALNFSSNGVALFEKLAKVAGTLTGQTQKLDAAIAKLNATFAAMGEAAAAAAGGVGDLGATFRATAAAANAAAGASRRAAAGFAASGASARAATGAAAAYARIAASTRRAALPGAASLIALPGAGGGFIPPAMRNVTPGAMEPHPGRIPYPVGGGGAGAPPGGGGGFGGFGGAGAFFGGIPGLVARGAKLAGEVDLGLAVDAIDEAAKLQRALIGVKNATGASDRQIDALRQKAFDVGDQTGTSAREMADMFAVMARSSGGVFTTKSGAFDMGGFMDIAPTMAKIAQIQHATRGISLDSGAQTVMQLAHLFHTYSGDDFNKVGDQLTRLSEMMPDSLQVALRQMTYFAPQFKSMGITNQDTISTMALLDRLGYGRGKGGTNIADLISASLGGLQLTQHAQAGKDALLRQIGVVDDKGKSKFFTDKGADLIGFLEQLNKYASKHGRIETVQEYKSAFGIQGGRIADLSMDPQFVTQIKKIEGVMQNPNISLDEQWTRYSGSAGVEMKRAWNDFQGVMTELGMQLLPAVTKAAHDLADGLHGAQVWLHEHKKLEKQISDYALGMVKNVEAFIHHNKDAFKALGPPLLLVWHSIERVVGVASDLASDFMDLYKAISVVTNPIVTLIDKLEGAGEHAIGAAVHKILNPGADTHGAVPHPSPGGFPRAIPAPPHVTVHVDARGAHDPKATGQAVKKGVQAAFADPRSTLAYAGATLRSHPHIPIALTVLGA